MPLLGVPFAADDAFAKEVAKLWAAREEVVQQQQAGSRAMLNEAFCPPDAHRNGFISDSEAELRALQDALRERRQAERLLAEGLRLDELASPLRAREGRVALPLTYTAASVARSPPTPAREPGADAGDAAAPATDAPGTPGVGAATAANPTAGDGAPATAAAVDAKGVADAAAVDDGDDGDKKKAKKPPPKPAWVDTYQPATIPDIPDEASPLKNPKRNVRDCRTQEDVDKYLVQMYKRGRDMVTKRDKTVERKKKELFGESGATFAPSITPFANGIRDRCGKTDVEMGKYYYETGQSHLKRRERTVVMKEREIIADLGMTDKPVISEFAKGLRDNNKGGEAVGKYLYTTGTTMVNRKEKQMERKRKELDNDQSITFKPEVSEKSRILGHNAYPPQIVGSSYKKAARYGGGTGTASKHAQMYDRGMQFEMSKENNLTRKVKEQVQEKSVGVTFEPRLNDRSRKLVERRKQRAARGGDSAGSPRAFSMRDLRSEYAFDPTSPALASPSPPPPRVGASPGDGGTGSPAGDVFDDLLLPPNLEQLLSEIRLKQEMRHLGVR